MKFRSSLGRWFCLLPWSGRAAWQVLVKQTLLFPAPPGPLLLPSVRRQCSASQLLCAVCPGRKEESTPQPLRPLSVASSCLFLRRCFSSGAFLARS